MKKIKNILIILFLLLLGMIIGYCLKKDKKCPDKICQVEIVSPDTIMINLIYKELLKQKILFPEIVLQKIKLETGNLKSNLCVKYNNILGIKYIKNSIAIGRTKEGFCIYKSYSQCISDYKRLQQYYLDNIQDRYAEDSNYVKKIKSFNK